MATIVLLLVDSSDNKWKLLHSMTNWWLSCIELNGGALKDFPGIKKAKFKVKAIKNIVRSTVIEAHVAGKLTKSVPNIITITIDHILRFSCY